jgi:hypothetical protein
MRQSTATVAERYFRLRIKTSLRMAQLPFTSARWPDRDLRQAEPRCHENGKVEGMERS